MTDEDVPPDADLDTAALAQEPAQAAHWGVPTRVRLIRRRRPATGFGSQARAAARTDEPRLLFVGAMGHGPNMEAAERLVRHLFPLVRQQRPDARLALAGQGNDALSFVTPEMAGVEPLRFVADISALYDRCAAFVCPMVNGGGTRIKLLEAAAFGLPIVATAMGAEGLALKDGEAIMLAETDAALADACVVLLNAADERARTGEAGRQAIARNFDAEAVQQRLEAVFAAA